MIEIFGHVAFSCEHAIFENYLKELENTLKGKTDMSQILIIDNEVQIRFVLRRVLESVSHTVI